MAAPKPISIEGIRYRSFSAACRAFGHAAPKIRHRIRAGMTLIEALNAKDQISGAKQHPNYVCWNAMRSRCYSPGTGGFKSYGGRGITMCPEWKDDFWRFVADMGVRPSSKHTVDRIDNEKGYTVENCRWATPSEQNRNMRTNVFIAHDGLCLCLTDWSRRTGIREDLLSYRARNNWPLHQLFSAPQPGRRRVKPKDAEKGTP